MIALSNESFERIQWAMHHSMVEEHDEDVEPTRGIGFLAGNGAFRDRDIPGGCAIPQICPTRKDRYGQRKGAHSRRKRLCDAPLHRRSCHEDDLLSPRAQ